MSDLSRVRAYDRIPLAFRFKDLPVEVIEDGRAVPNPIRDTAVFVVHGIGAQQFPETAVTLRSGFEDAIGEITEQNPDVSVPPPFVYEGYWADYAIFEKTFPEYWSECTDREKQFFTRLWQRRSMGAWETASWFIRQNLRLCSFAAVRQLGFCRAVTFVGMAPATFFTMIVFFLRSPRVLSEVLADVRVYCDPRGDIETAIVQRTDYRVGGAFLKLLGLDWNFRDLPEDELVNISGVRHRFSYVTWCAHSLGTIISYNVIGDILSRAEELKAELESRARERQHGEQEPEADTRLLGNIVRVERGLHRFITIGSPLEQIDYLFRSRRDPACNRVLRDWPKAAVERLSSSKREWWINFHHIADVISHALTAPRFVPLVSNFHGKRWRVPWVAHTAYWRDTAIMKHIVSRAYGPKLCHWPDSEFLNPKATAFLHLVSAWTVPALVALVLIAMVGSLLPLVR